MGQFRCRCGFSPRATRYYNPLVLVCAAHLYIQLHGVCTSVVSSVILRITDIQLNELVYTPPPGSSPRLFAVLDSPVLTVPSCKQVQLLLFSNLKSAATSRVSPNLHRLSSMRLCRLVAHELPLVCSPHFRASYLESRSIYN